MKQIGNTILITGGSSGIGLALAQKLLSLGNTVIVTGRSEERLAAVRRSSPGIHTFVCDQGDFGAVEALADWLASRFPNLNVLINNAGIGRKINLNDSKSAVNLDEEIRVNLMGPIHLVQLLLPRLKLLPSSMIVNVTSGLAFVPLPLKPVYCATKAAMHSYTQSLRVQLRRSCVTVVELAPPATNTNFNKGQEEINVRRLMDASQVAEQFVQGMQRGSSEILPGMSKVIRMIGRLAPSATLRAKEAENMAGSA